MMGSPNIFTGVACRICYFVSGAAKYTTFNITVLILSLTLRLNEPIGTFRFGNIFTAMKMTFLKYVAVLCVSFGSCVLFAQQPAPTEQPVPPPVQPTEQSIPAKPHYDPKKSLTRLAHPAVAARLGLTDEQRAEVQRLLTLRAQELAKASEEKWPEVIEQSEQKLADLLTPAQKTFWPKVFSEKTIRLIARKQPWADVLQWFASQAGLQLVMDAPPPGTFDYVDQIDYTPTEAIDKLNSVLQTKGYTLVRNDKMLMLFDLKRGKIPVQFLPKLKPEDLPQRGRFEYTTVIFPLERRNRADVIQVLEPFKGPFSQIVPMPGNSLMITDTAGTLLVLQKVIDSVENPSGPPAKDTPVPAPPPTVWKTYKIEKNEPGKIEEIFKEFAPTAKILRIGNSREVHVQLPEAEQSMLEDILKMLEGDSGAPTGGMVLVSYSITPYLNATPQQLWQLGRIRRGFGSAAAQQFNQYNPFDQSVVIGKEIIDILKKTFPAAIVSDAPVANNIVVLAPQPDQDKIKSFFESLKQMPQPEDEPVAKLYRYVDKAKKMNEETVKQLRSVVPTGVFSLDEEQGQILVVATAKEQEMLSKAVTELETAAMPEEDKIIVSYRMPALTATRFSAMLRQLVTKKELLGILELRDTKQGFVTVWATTRQHEIIRKLLDEMTGRKPTSQTAVQSDSDVAPNEPVLGVYPMLKGAAYTATQVLNNMLPEADCSYDYRTNSVIAVAAPELQPMIEKAVREFDKGVDDNVAFLPLKHELQQDVMRQLGRIAPRSVVVQNRRNLQMIATGPKLELDRIRAALTNLEDADAMREELVVHTLQTTAPSTVVAVLASVFPEVRATIDPANNQLVLQMNGDLKEPVVSLLKQLDGDLEFIHVRKIPSAQLLESLRTVAPRATFIVDRENSQVMVQGARQDVERVRKILTQAETSAPIAEEVYVHTFRQVYPYYVVAILREIYPEVKVAGYPTHNQLAVRMPPELRDKVLKLFEEVDGEIAIISLKKELPQELIALFPRVAPHAVVVPDNRNSQVMVYGPKPDVEKIQKLITASEAVSPIEEEIHVHTFRQAAPYYAAAIIREIYPEVKIAAYPTHNQLTLRFRPELKAKIKKLLDDMDGDIVFIPLKKELSPELLAAFPRIAPHATVIPDSQNALAMVYGSKPDVEKIRGMITTSESALPLVDEMIVHNLRHVDSASVVEILREIHPDAKIKDDQENGRIVIRIRPDKKDALTTLLAHLDAADPDAEKRYFKSYPIDAGFYSIHTVPGKPRYTSASFVADLQKLVPRAKLSFDDSSQQLIVWGTEKEHEIVDAAVKNMSDDGKGKKFGRFQLRRLDPYNAMAIIRRLYPTVVPTYDYQGLSVIVEGHPRLIQKIGEMITAIDPAEPNENDPTVRFYSFQYEPTPTLVQGIQRLAPTAFVASDKDAKQVMVIAKPLDQKIIAANVDAIASTFTAPEEPMLFIYPAGTEQRERLEAFVRTAAKDLKGVAIVPDKSPNQVSVWAKPSEHKLISTILQRMQETRENEPHRELKVFHMSIGDLVTAQDILKISHPDATPFVDRQGNRLLVWATPEELAKITQTLSVQGSVDNRQMLAYPIAGAKPETVMKVIQDVFKGLKITPEPQTRRLLVWATPDEHVKIAEIVEQTNKQTDPESELAEKFVAYSAANLDPSTILHLFKALIPDADVHADATTDKITIRARVREHVQIKELFEQLRQKDELLRPVLQVYPIGDTDPVMIEAMLRSQLPNAESMSSEEIIIRLGWQYYYERMPWYRNAYGNQNQTTKKLGYYKVDPKTQSVFVFAIADDQKEVGKGIEQIVAVGNREGVRPVVKRYSLEELSYWDAYRLLQEIAPSAVFESVYTYNPDGVGGNYRLNYRDFLAYARESEHEKIDTLVKELNDRSGSGKKEMFAMTLPNGSRYSREKLIETIQKLYPDIAPIPGGASNQILVWSSKYKLDKIRQIVDEVCKPVKDDRQTVVKSYSLQYIDVEDAKNWLAAICPNASFDPESGVTQTLDRRPTIRQPNQPESKQLIVLATPLEHLEIAKALSEIDKDLPDTHKLIPRIYPLADFPPATFQPLRLSLIQAFPNAVCTQGAEQQSIMVVATEDDHRQIIEFLKAYKTDRDDKRPSLEVYVLKRQNYYRIQTLIQRIAPQALIFPSSKPDQIAVWGTPKEQTDVSTALTRLETASTETDNQVLKIYKVGNKQAYAASRILSYQFPGSIIIPTSQNELLAWTSPVDHEAMAKMLDVVAEAFPEPIFKVYYFKHVPLGEAATTLNRIYSGQATFSVRPSTDDLLVHATPEVQENIARNIAEIDVPRPTETEALPVAYDLSALPLAQIPVTANLIRQALPGRVVVLPSSVPGQLVVWTKVAEHDKVRSMVEQMLRERPDSTASMEVYAIHRGTAATVQQTLLGIVPTARYGVGLNPNQLLVWAKASDHVKVRNIVDKLNEPETDKLIATYPLRNIYATGAMTLLRNLITTQGLDVQTNYEPYGNQLVVQGNAEAQTMIKDLLDKLRTEDRELEAFVLETVDPYTADTAISALFGDEPYAVRPGVGIDQSTNIIFVQGTKQQIAKARRLLINMGETQLRDPALSEQPGGHMPPPTTSGTGATLQRSGNSQLRVIRIEGNTDQAIRELEKLWPQYSPNRLLINRQDRPLIQKKSDAPDGLFSMNDPAEKLENRAVDPGESELNATVTPVENSTVSDSPKAVVPSIQQVAPNVYLTVNEDGSLTMASYDATALDRLELLLERINSRIVFEGRDYTIYSVRNVSADMVALRIQLILRDRLAGRQQRFTSSGFGTSQQVPRLEVVPDIANNTITVRGAKAERREVANLIALFDVSELPGERSIRKPIKVPIKNTQATRVLQQLLNVYQQKIQSTRLPGGVYPRVTVDNITNSIEIMVPEPLATEIKEYAMELDRLTVEEPARKVHVIPLEVKSQVIQRALNVIRQSSQSGFSSYPTMYSTPIQNTVPITYPGAYPMQRGF